MAWPWPGPRAARARRMALAIQQDQQQRPAGPSIAVPVRSVAAAAYCGGRHAKGCGSWGPAMEFICAGCGCEKHVASLPPVSQFRLLHHTGAYCDPFMVRLVCQNTPMMRIAITYSSSMHSDDVKHVNCFMLPPPIAVPVHGQKWSKSLTRVCVSGSYVDCRGFQQLPLSDHTHPSSGHEARSV